MTPLFVSLTDAATMLGVGRAKARHILSRNGVAAHKFGTRTIRYAVADIEAIAKNERHTDDEAMALLEKAYAQI